MLANMLAGEIDDFDLRVVVGVRSVVRFEVYARFCADSREAP